MSLPASERVRRRLSWSVLVIACLSYLLLALAEHDIRGSEIATPPDAPLPFARHRVFGIDLRHLTSLEARDWLVSAGSEPLALVALPLDADVVAALAQEAEQPRALAAVASMVEAAGGSPIAACLHKPPGIVSGVGIAQAAVGILVERFPNEITYLSACNHDQNRDWQRAIAGAVTAGGPPRAAAGQVLVPVASGAAAHIIEVDGTDDIEVVASAGGGYSLLVLDIVEPLPQPEIERVERALADSAGAALVLLRPARGLDPSTVAASIQPAQIRGETLPEGFTSVAAPSIARSEGWHSSTVGAVPYLRAEQPGASLAADVVGADVYLIALLSPEGGQVAVWIDPDPAMPNAPPDAIVDLSADQARDAAMPVMTGLPARRHRVVMQAIGDGETGATISGIFVAGRPSTSWTGLLAAIALVAVAAAALGERSYAAVERVRASGAPAREATAAGHPRGFARRR